MLYYISAQSRGREWYKLRYGSALPNYMLIKYIYPNLSRNHFDYLEKLWTMCIDPVAFGPKTAPDNIYRPYQSRVSQLGTM